MKKGKKIIIGIIVALLVVVLVGYIYLFTGSKIKNVSNDVIKGEEGTKSLVIYFTRQGEIPGNVDAVSSATQNSNEGMDGSDTEAAARMIQSLTGADLYQIYTEHYYRKSFAGTAATAWIEEQLNLRPKLAAKPDNLDDYDTIYVGYPIWWFNAPMAIGSFLESYDLSGKTIVPFCTSQDNDISVSMDYIKEVASGANVLDGYRIHGADVDDVKEWLQRIGVLNDNNTENQNAEGSLEMKTKKSDKNYESATIPDELEYIPDGYEAPADQQGSLQKITYDTWESFTYDQKSQKLTKEAWVYVPYGYDENEKYNVFYLSHGGWSNETTIMGTDKDPHSFKNVMDHAIEDGKIKPLIIVLPTYNNTSEEDSGDYSLAIQLTNQFHNELVNDLIPAVESKFSTYAENVTEEGLEASRDHRGFGDFSMGSVNTWNTFRYCLDYFRYFMPMSGSYSTDGQYMADLVRQQGYGSDDFFIFSASGTNDFAYHAFKAQIMAMAQDSDGMFRFANNETDGNLSFLEREGYEHDQKACDEYTYNGLRFFWNAQ